MKNKIIFVFLKLLFFWRNFKKRGLLGIDGDCWVLKGIDGD